ncbi:TonB-dependent receptor [Rhodoferax sp.]|uniref:TonB-dependent receptor n=1 Tax=Rhodoferax sp. TaxID=50421 RepID=UPI0027210ABD|nr:TonB-dependent receptor [Rhodoferax sp.]MDO9196958.1 TonB-dependent receptor [Rhodoferax sp.]
MKYITLSLSACLFGGHAMAADEKTATLPVVTVSDVKPDSQPVGATTVDKAGLARKLSGTSDTARLLNDVPGVNLYGAGGVSSLPVIHGLADDRLRIKVDGMDLISACANHMNPPLSYIDPTNVGDIQVFAGITPVSVGGDSIGGAIVINSAAPEFARPGEGTLLKGQAGAFYRSNGNGKGGNVALTVASDKVSLTYNGATTEAGNYKAAADFKPAGLAAPGRTWLAGDEVGSSRYKSENQSLGLALRHENHLLELKLGMQDIPYQGFPNQRMDMTGNDSQQINLRYVGQYQWGALEARAYHEKTRHAMQFGDNKRFWYGPTNNVPGMPMDTEGKNTGVLVKADLVLSERDVLRVGGEVQNYLLNDWWLPSGGGMAPNTFWNINNGERDRVGVFAEWEAHWNSQWVTQIGARGETVTMNTGTVQGYNTSATYLADATAFNASDRRRTDNNLDLAVLARYTPDATQTLEFGYAQKTRSPNLYERFAWSTGGMAMRMVNWVGDGNGYVGNMSLKPEVAHTLSASANWHDAAQEIRGLTVTPYLTYVQDYIDASACSVTRGSCLAINPAAGFLHLTLANQSARIYGFDVSGYQQLSKTSDYGSFTATGMVSYVRGKNTTTDSDLYNMMPLNAKLAVVQRMGSWTNTIEAHLVDAKTDVSQVRNEIKTAGYGLLNLRSSYQWEKTRLDIGIENALDKFYASPLGGAYVGQGTTMNTSAPYGTAVPGAGRSINVGVTVKF